MATGGDDPKARTRRRGRIVTRGRRPQGPDQARGPDGDRGLAGLRSGPGGSTSGSCWTYAVPPKGVWRRGGDPERPLVAGTVNAPGVLGPARIGWSRPSMRG